MEERKTQKDIQKCNIILEDRKRLSLSAVVDIDTFDESGFTAITSAGALVVKGSDFHISKLNVDTGELVVEGDFDSCVFNNSFKGRAGGGILARMFK